MKAAGEETRLLVPATGGCEHTRDASLQRIHGDPEMVGDRLLHERFGAGAQALTIERDWGIDRTRLRTRLEAA